MIHQKTHLNSPTANPPNTHKKYKSNMAPKENEVRSGVSAAATVMALKEGKNFQPSLSP